MVNVKSEGQNIDSLGWFAEENEELIKYLLDKHDVFVSQPELYKGRSGPGANRFSKDRNVQRFLNYPTMFIEEERKHLLEVISRHVKIRRPNVTDVALVTMHVMCMFFAQTQGIVPPSTFIQN